MLEIDFLYAAIIGVRQVIWNMDIGGKEGLLPLLVANECAIDVGRNDQDTVSSLTLTSEK